MALFSYWVTIMEATTVQLIGIGIQTVLFMLAGYGVVVRTDNTVSSLKDEFREMQKEIKAMADVVTRIAVQTVRIDSITERINAMDQRVNDLSRRVDK
jgi:prefoldin subunit 5